MEKIHVLQITVNKQKETFPIDTDFSEKELIIDILNHARSARPAKANSVVPSRPHSLSWHIFLIFSISNRSLNAIGFQFYYDQILKIQILFFVLFLLHLQISLFVVISFLLSLSILQF